MAIGRRAGRSAVPAAVSVSLLLAACGTNGADVPVAQQPPVLGSGAPLSAKDVRPAGGVGDLAPSARDQAPAVEPDLRAARAAVVGSGPARISAVPRAPRASKPTATDGVVPAPAKAASARPVVESRDGARAADRLIYERTGGATDVGVSKTGIRLGSVNMHGMAGGNLITAPAVRGNLATITSINDRGGVLGRRLSLVDCDDGPGDVARSKACIKKLVGQDRIFALITGVDWATASIHEDLKQNGLPYVGAWAYSQTEWQDPYMFPTHMSMIHEAMAGANWVRNVIKPKTYGLLCLTSPEMQLACNQVAKILDASGAELVKRVDVAISENTMSPAIIAMRAANPDHIVHYVINPMTVAKFMLEAGQQNYLPPRGVSGNHMMAEVLGSVFGTFAVNRYWTNTTYKIWGPEFIATMNKYARGNAGSNHHIVQAGYVALNVLAQAAKAVGPNLTRAALMAELGNGTVWASDASLDQKFTYTPAERHGEGWNREYGQGREFMYRYSGTDTTANPDGSPSGWVPDPDQFVIHTDR